MNFLEKPSSLAAKNRMVIRCVKIAAITLLAFTWLTNLKFAILASYTSSIFSDRCRLLFFRAMNHHRPCKKPDRISKRITCPPGMLFLFAVLMSIFTDSLELAKEFLELAQPAYGPTFKNADDDGELQVEEESKTKCKLLIE